MPGLYRGAFGRSPAAPAASRTHHFARRCGRKDGAGGCRQTAPHRLRTHGSPASGSLTPAEVHNLFLDSFCNPIFPEEDPCWFMQEAACRGFAGCSLSGARSERLCASQANSTSVTGVVVDPTGAVVPNATVEIQNPVSGFSLGDYRQRGQVHLSECSLQSLPPDGDGRGLCQSSAGRRGPVVGTGEPDHQDAGSDCQHIGHGGGGRRRSAGEYANVSHRRGPRPDQQRFRWRALRLR